MEKKGRLFLLLRPINLNTCGVNWIIAISTMFSRAMFGTLEKKKKKKKIVKALQKHLVDIL